VGFASASAQVFPPIIHLNALEFVNHGPAGDISLPNVGRIIFQLRNIRTVEKMEGQ